MPPSNKKKQLNSIVCDTNTNNIEIQKDKPIDNFFGIIIDKPPSPINILLNENQAKTQQSNTDLYTENNPYYLAKLHTPNIWNHERISDYRIII